MLTELVKERIIEFIARENLLFGEIKFHQGNERLDQTSDVTNLAENSSIPSLSREAFLL